MSIKNKGFVLLETIIVMSVLLIGMILLYSNYNRIFMNSGKISYYDNVEDMYTAYYVYLNKDTINTNSNEVVDVSDNEVLKNLDIERIYFIDKDVFTNLYTKEVSNCENLDSLDCFDGTTIAYLKSIENKTEVNKCENNKDCLTIVKIKRGNHYYFAKFEAYKIKQDALNGDNPEYPTPDPSNPGDSDVPEITQKIYNYSYNGNYQTFTAPIAGDYKLETWGAQGGGTQGGFGGYSVGNVTLNKNDTLYIYIGGTTLNGTGGYNGGGSVTDNMYGGGGATHIAKTSGLLSSLINNKNSILIVSAGGGGEGNGYAGGSGGGNTGVNGTGDDPGSAGTQTASGSNSGGCGGNKGSFGIGGSGSWYSESLGGGGAGYYGGASGGGRNNNGSGGGGSGYIGNSLLLNKVMYCYDCTESSDASTKTIKTTCHNSTPTENCVKEGNGYARITLIGE